VTIALDATYSLGRNLSGVGVYSREILFGLARAHPEARFRFCYRPHRFLRSFRETLPWNGSRSVLIGTPPGNLFHALNQRVDFPRGSGPRRVVSTFHDLFVMTGDYSSPEFRTRFTAQARSAAERSDAVIAVSQFTASQVETLLKIERSRIFVVPHGVHPPPQAPVDRQNIVLFVGAIQRRKNVARLVRAFEKMPGDWKLVLAGASDGYGAAEELQAVNDSPHRSSIDLLGYVPDAELDRLYRCARIFAFPSLDEGFGMPVLDAMAHGVPVIASQSSALPEVAGDAALLIDPTDCDALADALLRLATNPVLRDDLARRGLERAREFAWESAVERTWSVYNELK
jgi:glycosyltransferase involved in cell wall biosynthesis